MRREVGNVETRVSGTYRRNERNRLRVGALEVSIRLDLQGTPPAKVERCLELFEDFCVVTATVRKGVDVAVTVTDLDGNELYSSSTVSETN